MIIILQLANLEPVERLNTRLVAELTNKLRDGLLTCPCSFFTVVRHRSGSRRWNCTVPAPSRWNT